MAKSDPKLEIAERLLSWLFPVIDRKLLDCVLTTVLIKKPPKDRSTNPQTKSGIRWEWAISKLPDIITGIAKIKDRFDVSQEMIFATNLDVTAPARPVTMNMRPKVGTDTWSRSFNCGIRGAKTDRASESVKKDARSENIVFLDTVVDFIT